jgi:hypothetical protein
VAETFLLQKEDIKELDETLLSLEVLRADKVSWLWMGSSVAFTCRVCGTSFCFL